MYRLVSGFVAHLTQKQEVRSPFLPLLSRQVGLAHLVSLLPALQYSVLIMGLDNAGKTTFLGASLAFLMP
jgi:hypothetical protein